MNEGWKTAMMRALGGAGALAIALVSMAAVQAASAPTPSSAPAPAVQAVLSCRTITEDAARLACFDKAVSAMGEAQSKGDLVTLDREQRRAVRRQAFGLALPAFTLFDRGEKPEEADRLTATVASAHQDAYGKWILKLDDGAVWVQTDDNEMGSPPHKGSSVVISRGTLGSFFLKVDGHQAIRAKRQL
jgi:hypothetical protein